MNTMQDVINSLKRGSGVLVTDDPDRENEADLIFSAETLTPEQMTLLINDCSGIVCLCIKEEVKNALQLPMMTLENNSKYQTPFTVSIEAKEGVTTGVSAKDRVTTVKAAISDEDAKSKIVMPGHIFPLCAHSEGLNARPGHTEATVALMELSGLKPVGVLCELMNRDGTMAKGEQVSVYSKKHSFPIVAISEIIQYQKSINNKLLKISMSD